MTRRRVQPYRIDWSQRTAYMRFLRGKPVQMFVYIRVADELYEQHGERIAAHALTKQVRHLASRFSSPRLDLGPLLSHPDPATRSHVFHQKVTVSR
jgi:hypothetical protein